MPVTIHRTIIARLLTLTELLATADCPFVHVTRSLPGFYYHFIRYFAIFNDGLAISKNRVNTIYIWLCPKRVDFLFCCLVGSGWWIFSDYRSFFLNISLIIQLLYNSKNLYMYVAILRHTHRHNHRINALTHSTIPNLMLLYTYLKCVQMHVLSSVCLYECKSYWQG